MPKRIAILILAAGASSRMGQIKQLLPWKKNTLLGHVVKEALETKIEPLAIVLGAHAEAIKKRIQDLTLNCTVNEHWETGMGSSISHGVQYLLSKDPTLDGILLLLGDQPLVDTEYLLDLVHAFEKGEHGIIATAYNSTAGVPALFGSKYFDELLKLSTKGAQRLIEVHSSDILTRDGQNRIFDIDTPEDYKQLNRFK